ncbi:MCE family protein [Nocardioides speluncae]|uniref:MCE family protein n=1 Tax=Nocardioides speluncae TaxID=2670337 RepID=UPI000D695128|nr:MCE family protein [Nocardioides speluncae]
MSRVLNVRVVAVVLLAALLASLLLIRGEAERRTVTAHFPRAVSIFVGTDVRILGVNVGEVTAVVPEGNSVRVEMEYDAKYQVPADAKAVIVTPTLVADRFIQLTPVFRKGDRAMADGADIALPDTGVPVELDRIYASLRDLSVALGPNGVNKDGTLDNVLRAGAENLEGKGELGNQMVRDLAMAATTFGNGSGELFATVRELAQFTKVLAGNDKLVRAFLKDLAGVSATLVTERTELELALAEVAKSVGTVQTFVKTHRKALVTDIAKLTRVVKNLATEKDALATTLRAGPLGAGNLALAYNAQTKTVGSRLGLEGNIADADGFLCAVVKQSNVPKAGAELACRLFKQLLEPLINQAGKPSGKQSGDPADGPTARDADQTQEQFSSETDGSLNTLMGGS